MDKLNEALRHTLAVIIPSQSQDGDALGAETHQRETEAALRFFGTLCGGATAVPAHGSWLHDDGRLAVESVTVVISWTNEVTPDTLDRVTRFAEELKNRTSQDAVSVLIDGRLLFI